MNANNTILHRRTFEGLIAQADQRDREGDEVALAILYAALAAARARLGAQAAEKAALEFLQQER